MLKYTFHVGLIGALYSLMTYINDVGYNVFNLSLVDNGLASRVAVDTMNSTKLFVIVFLVFGFLMASLQAIIVAITRSQQNDPYVQVSIDGTVSFFASIIIAVWLNFAMTAVVDSFIILVGGAFAVDPSSPFYVAGILNMVFWAMHTAILTLPATAFIYDFTKSISFEPQEMEM